MSTLKQDISKRNGGFLFIPVSLFRRPAWFPHQVDDAVTFCTHTSSADTIDLRLCAYAVVVELAAIIIAHDHRQCVITFFLAHKRASAFEALLLVHVALGGFLERMNLELLLAKFLLS